MAVTIPRADPTSPASVADASFSTARRGYQPDEVRALLRDVAAELRRLQERERSLEDDLRTSRADVPVAEPVLDDETVTRLLGEETLRVLQTARESASQIKIKAEEAAARILREATEEGSRIRSAAEVDAARIRSEAGTEAAAELSLAKEQGREMVAEARAYRERVLSELTRRRETARQQIEQLVHGRDRLLQVFERARLVAVDVVSELEPLVEPEEFVDLSPTTGPIPVIVPSAALPRHLPPDDDLTVAGEPDAGEASLDESSGDVADDPDASTAPEPDDASNVVSLFGDATTATERADVDGLFARLRAGTADPVPSDSAPSDVPDAGADEVAATDGAPADGPAADELPDDELPETIFEQRDAELTPLIVAAARSMKRVLADEQNEILGVLRAAKAAVALDDLLPIAAEHTDRYVTAISSELAAARSAGVRSISDLGDHDDAGTVDAALSPTDLAAVTASVHDGLVMPLRDRLERSVVDGDGDTDEIVRRLRSVYREWKTQHIDEQLDDVLRLAHGRGVLAGVAPGTPLCWAVDPAGPACPDAEDNSLAGEVPAGDAYPTGDVTAPAHPGCRCLLSRVGK